MIVQEPHTFVDLLRRRAEAQPDQRGYTFLFDAQNEEAHLTYGELYQAAQTIAGRLHDTGATGQRALLLYTPGLEFVKAFFGCLLAGVVAVPSYPPRGKRPNPRLQAIIQDAQPAVVLCDEKNYANLGKEIYPALGSLPTFDTESMDDSHWEENRCSISPNDLAFLQYTSGSTGTPKGIMISHGNLVHNLSLIQRTIGDNPHHKGVIWLPPFHDMGLIGGIMSPVYSGIPTVNMSPATFLQQPYRWLQAISQHRATCSAAPNFAYDLCVEMISPEQCQGLDLSSWETAFNGAEPIQAGTLERFATKFGPYGFRLSTFSPSYGMAESTLYVTASNTSNGKRRAYSIAEATGSNRSPQDEVDGTENAMQRRMVVSCGQIWMDQRIEVVDPNSCVARQEGIEGEIWVGSPSVGSGYWNKPDETERTFHAFLHTDKGITDDGPFLRTGDLGFIKDSQLFVTGRIKDLIVIHGRNHYPQDIEQTAEKSHVALQFHACAAFSVEINQVGSDEQKITHRGEQVVVVAELQRIHRRANVEEVANAIRTAVSQAHDLAIYGVVLIQPGRMPTTTSGKIQRYLCQAQFLNHELREIGRSILGASQNTDELLTERRHLDTVAHPRDSLASGSESVLNSDQDPTDLSDTVVAERLRAKLAELLSLPPRQIDLTHPVNALGLGSINAMALKQTIETEFKVDLPVELFFEEVNTLQLASQIRDAVHRGVQPFPPTQEPSVHKPLDTQNRVEQHDIRHRHRGHIDDSALNLSPSVDGTPSSDFVPQEVYQFSHFPEIASLQQQLANLPFPNPYFRPHTGINGNETTISGQTYVNYASYNYVGLSGHPAVLQSVQAAISQYGTSVSASRLASGETLLHQELERGLADFVGVEDCIVYVGGFTTNVTTIGHLLGQQDLILYDSLIHNSALQGATLSGATKRAFPHNDWQALDALLTTVRQQYRRVLIVIEGVYSMDGDLPDLPHFVRIKQQHKALLMVDEAHSLGVLGSHGRGLAEHFGVDPAHVDIWMGTLSKSLASCGGYIAGSKSLINYLKYSAPGFVYSVGMSPQNTAAALAALHLLQEEPERVDQLRQRSHSFLTQAHNRGLNTGGSHDSAVIPIIVGNSNRCMQLSHRLLEHGISVLPIIFPAVAEDMARLRFFISSLHTEAQIRQTVGIMAEELTQLSSGRFENAPSSQMLI